MTGDASPAPERLSLNQITLNRLSLGQASEACARAGIGWIAPWRDKVADAGGAQAAAKLVRDAGLRVSSVCRGGFFTAATAENDGRALKTTGVRSTKQRRLARR